MKKIAVLTTIALFCWGCSTFTASYKLGAKAALNKNWDLAISCFGRALQEDPGNRIYNISLLRAKLAASYFHLNKARELASRQKIEEARAEYEKALSYGVLDKAVADEAKALGQEKAKEEVVKEVRIEPPVKLRVDKEKIDLRFPVEAPLRSIFQALGKHARINILFDEQFREVPFSIDLVDMTFEQALSLLCLASKNFYSIIDEKTVIIAPDLPQKRAQYELNAIKTFYLSNVNAEDLRVALQQMLRTAYKQPQIYVDKNLNSLTIRDTPAAVELAEKVIRSWDKAKGEVVVDLEIMEVSRIRLRTLGIELGQQAIGLRFDQTKADVDGYINLRDIDFSKKGSYQIALPAAVLQFLESDSGTKVISQPRLRGSDGEEMTYVVGDQIPIIRTSFQPIAAGGVAQQPMVNYDFKDVGIDVKIKPRIHSEKEITLELEIKIKSLTGTSIASIPIISTREVKNVIRLKDGETNLLAGLLKDEERKTSSGIAGLKNIPILGGLFSSTNQAIQQTDVIMTITPYIIRTISLSEQDLKPIWVGPEGISSGGRESGVLSEEELLERRARQRAEQEEPARREARVQNRVSLTPANIPASQNQEFRVNINIATQEEISNMSLSISFDPQVAKMKDVTKGGFLGQMGAEVPFLKNIDNSSGVCIIGFSSPDVSRGIKGAGIVATLIFEAQEKGESTISVADLSANTPDGKALTFETNQSRIIVR